MKSVSVTWLFTPCHPRQLYQGKRKKLKGRKEGRTKCGKEERMKGKQEERKKNEKRQNSKGGKAVRDF